MKEALAIALLLSIGAPPTSRDSPQASGITKQQLDALVKKLQAEGKSWVEAQRGPESWIADHGIGSPPFRRPWISDVPIDRAVRRELEKVQFETQSAPLLIQTLRSAKQDAELYAVSALLGRLTAAKPEVIGAVLPAVYGIHRRTRSSYKPLPRLPEPPPRRKPRSAATIMKEIEALEKRHKAVMLERGRVSRHNQLICQLERTTFKLMLAAEDRSADYQLVRMMVAAEGRKSLAFIIILDTIAAKAKEMDAEQAGRLYSSLESSARPRRMVYKKGYNRLGSVEVIHYTLDGLYHSMAYPGKRILIAANDLAPIAKRPLLKVPKKQEIDEYHRKRAKGRR